MSEWTGRLRRASAYATSLGCWLLLGWSGPVPGFAQGTSKNADVVRMAPVSVQAGPLGLIGIKCAVDVGVLGSLFRSPHIKSMAVVEVVQDSAAQRAGLEAKDVVTKINGVAVTHYTVEGLKEALGREKGDTLAMEIVSPGSKSPRTLEITLGSGTTPSSP